MVNYEKIFEINPFKTNITIVGRDKETEDTIYRIMSGSMLLIEGKEGYGKTILLKYAIDNFKGKGKVIYVDASKLDKKLDIVELLRKKPKGMILLMDNVQELSIRNNEKIKYYYDEDRIKSVVFTTSSYASVEFTDAIRDRIGKNVIKLKKLTQQEVSKIIKTRLGKREEMIPSEIIKELYINSENLNEILNKCAALCNHAKENKRPVELGDIKKLKL